jgi:amidophosphoribosyltransferase
VRATGSSSDKFCRACFDGIYPIPVPEDEEEPKFVLEERTAQRE